jgi:trehalose-phosphatase
MLSYDAALSPEDISMDAAQPRSWVLWQLRRIARSTNTLVALISARPVREILPRLRPMSAWIVGEHGWEARSPEGDIYFHPLGEPARRALMEAVRCAVNLGWASRLEVGSTHIRLITHGLHPREARELTLACERAWRETAAASGLRMVLCDGGLELRAPGYDNGHVVGDLVRLGGREAIPIYIGGADEDEEAFRVVRDPGLGIRVGGDDRPSHAAGRLASRDDVAWFLQNWLIRVEGWSPAPDTGDRVPVMAV